MLAVVVILAASAAGALALRPRFVLPHARAPAGPHAVPVPLVAGLSASIAVLLLVPFPLGPPGAVAAGLLAIRAVRRLEPAAARRRRTRLEAALPHVVDLMSTCLAAGASPSGALARIAEVVEPPMAEELGTYVGRLRLGADPATVWAALAGHAELGVLGRALHRSSQTGASVAEALTRVGTELRAQRRVSLEARARTIEVKASVPLGLCLLPAFVLVGIVPLVAGSFSLTFLGS